MVITVASGKGGTGKTTFAVNLAYALAQRGENVRLLDCDVEEPNDHLFVRPVFTEEKAVALPKPVWDQSTCTGCGKCAEACNYGAIAVVKGKVLIFNDLCHSCGVCSYVCPEGSLTEKDAVIGKVQADPSHNPFFFAHGLLNIGEALAPSVARSVKEYIEPEAINIIDASPGTACTVVEAVEGSDVVLLVTEPTPFGLHDLTLAVEALKVINRPAAILVNRADWGAGEVQEYAAREGIPVVLEIPHLLAVAEGYARSRPLVESAPELRQDLVDLRDSLVRTIRERAA